MRVHLVSLDGSKVRQGVQDHKLLLITATINVSDVDLLAAGLLAPLPQPSSFLHTFCDANTMLVHGTRPWSRPA